MAFFMLVNFNERMVSLFIYNFVTTFFVATINILIRSLLENEKMCNSEKIL